MRVLVACEFSGVVREAFRRRGHDAWSCDLDVRTRGDEGYLSLAEEPSRTEAHKRSRRPDYAGTPRITWDQERSDPPTAPEYHLHRNCRGDG